MTMTVTFNLVGLAVLALLVGLALRGPSDRAGTRRP
jgi:hypothetical protein